MKLKIIKAAPVISGDQYSACLALIKCAYMTYEEEVDVSKAMKLGKGMMSPVNAFVMIVDTPEGEKVLRHCWDLAKWIETSGRRPL